MSLSKVPFHGLAVIGKRLLIITFLSWCMFAVCHN